MATVLTVAVSAVLLPASATSPAGAAGAPAEIRTVDSDATQSFGRIADAVLTQRTAALLDSTLDTAPDTRPARRTGPLLVGNARLSARVARAEGTALSSLRTRKARLAALGEAYTAADTRITVDRARVHGGRATVQITETTTLTYKKIRGDEPPTTAFQAHHELSFAATPDRKWELTGMTPKDDGPRAVNEPGTPVAKSRDAGPSGTPAATSWPARQQVKPPGTAGYNYATMAAYAEKHWKNYNPAYRKFNDAGGDCTNFISQALKAGGWKHDSGLYSDYRNWWYDASYQTMSWVGADDWAWFTLYSKRASNLSNVYYMGVGDIMQMDFNRDGSKDHSMITTYRSRTGTPYLTYHSTNTYRKSVASIVVSNPNAVYFAYRT
ncbi:amidase domain-containing protein [Streptomyces sp. A3M-1-3]|uniref:amidase domain-containing protein n=1 Tax=Streptomyces sp. A3M-1-3 TaxID=2962044 RepID=UPI0020B6F157|nr:amidase domain-containing protein [Streptomyces sp. A3M-1-3]MCP3819421.1 amidase domain-containing protein [Streptomyces sp. A3M-1-3]